MSTPTSTPYSKRHALGGELLEPALDHPLLDLEVRHAEADQPAAGLVALVDRDGVARAAQLLRRGQAGRTGADHRDRAAGLDRGRARDDPALVEGAVDDRDLDLLDRDGVALADLQHAGGLAGRRAQPPGELREVVGGVQLLDRLAPAVAVDEVVPVRDQVAQRAAVVAERHAALHAARALVAQALDGQLLDELLVVRRALAGVALRRVDAGDLEEGSELAHYATRSRMPSRCAAASSSAISASARL